MTQDDKNDRSPDSDAFAPDAAPAGDGGAAGVRPGATDVQAYIGRQLRAVYDDVAKQPIPERLLALMAQLEAQDPTASS